MTFVHNRSIFVWKARVFYYYFNHPFNNPSIPNNTYPLPTTAREVCM